MKCRPASRHGRRGDLRPADTLPAPRHARTGRTDETTPNGTTDGKGNGTRERNGEATRERDGAAACSRRLPYRHLCSFRVLARNRIYRLLKTLIM